MLILSLSIVSCKEQAIQEYVDQKNNQVDNEEQQARNNAGYSGLKSQLGIALQSGGISPKDSEIITGQINELEFQGESKENIDELRAMLSKLSVGGQQNPSEEPKTERDESKTFETPSKSEIEQLPECSEVLLTQSPVDINSITAIEPIGSSNPPEHTLPSMSTDVYIFVNTRETEKTVPLYAPGNMWLISITPRYGATQDPEDHVIQYAFCKDVYGIVDHVKSFSPEIKEIINNFECKYGGVPGDNKCPILLFEPIKAGTLLGTVGRLQGNFNFGTWDLRHNNSFIAPEKYNVRALHSTCPFDYYSAELKGQLMNLIDRSDKKCGTVEYDIPGTLQGEWFYGNAGNNMPGDWVNHLFFGYSNNIPEAAVISVGGVFLEPTRWMFKPKLTGTKNLAFQYATDDKIYCYENDGNSEYRSYEKGVTGKILVQMTDPMKLKIEHKSGACSEDESFVNPTVYNR